MATIVENIGRLYTCDDADAVLDNAWIIIEGRKISALGSGPPPEGDYRERIDLKGAVAFPGFVNAHHHFFQSILIQYMNDLNQNIYTVMSYNAGYKSVFGTTTDSIQAYGWSATPMALDVAAIQYIYGTNPNHNSGNNTYLLPTSNFARTDWVGIYDTGGIDQIINPGNAPASGPALRDSPN